MICTSYSSAILKVFSAIDFFVFFIYVEINCYQIQDLQICSPIL